ncbi:MAG: peptidylprolyl isomerase [Anaerolineae bacterium]|nr:peptidylprolyl isomerase [Anaerolineae bacterium]
MRRFIFVALVTMAVLGLVGLAAPSLAQGDPTATPAARHPYSDLPQTTTVAGFPVIGKPEAPLLIAEFSNFSCPGCALYHATIKQIIEAHVRTGRARFMLLPIVFGIGNDPSFLAAQAALCAGRQNAFWEMHDALFEQHTSQGAQSFNLTTLRATAEKLALNADQIIACVQAGETAEVVFRSARLAQETEIQYTPTLMWSLDNGQTLQWFTRADGRRYESGVPFEEVDKVVTLAVSGKLAMAMQATATTIAQITPTKGNPLANLTYQLWRSSDGLLSLEIPRGWLALTNPNPPSPISYVFAPSEDEPLGISLIIIPTVALGVPDLAANATPAEIARYIANSEPEAQIREVTAGRNSEYRGVGIRPKPSKVALRNGQTVLVARALWLLALDSTTIIVLQAVSPLELREDMQEVLEQAAKTLQVDRVSALGILDRVFNPTPTITPTFNATADFIDRATAVALQFVPFRSADGAISFEMPQSWRVEPNPRISAVTYTLFAPVSPTNNLISLSVRAVSSLGIAAVGEQADALTLMNAAFGRDPNVTITPVTVGTLKGAGIVDYQSASDRSGGFVDLERRVWLLDVAPGYVLLIQVLSAPAQRAQVNAAFERLTQTLVLDAAISVAAVEARLNATPTPSVPTVTDFVPVSVGEGACVGVKDPEGVSVPPDGKGRQYSAPEQVIKPERTYCAILTTAKGRIVIQLYSQIAPQHVNSFVFLAQRGFYDGTTFHRVIPGFVAQGGDPTGTGTGGPGYRLPLEVNPAVKYDRVGVVGMARTSDPNSAGSQFFITYVPLPNLDPSAQSAGYTIFGQVVEGMDVVEKLTPRDPSNATTEGDLLISVRIVDLGVR